MPNTNDIFVTELKEAHLKWGSHRHTNTRGIIYGEGYLQIPANEARLLQINNSNLVGANTVYRCNSSDGFLVNVDLLAAGSADKYDICAKQFQGKGNLKALGDWFYHINAIPGDKVEIKWITPTEIVITKL